MRRRDDDEDYLEPHRGTLILVLGLLSVLVIQLLGPFAWWMGGTDLRKMRAGRMDPQGEGLTRAGYICGIIGTVMLILSLVAVVGMIVFFVFLAARVPQRPAQQPPVVNPIRKGALEVAPPRNQGVVWVFDDSVSTA